MSLDESILKYMGGTSANSLAHILQPQNTEEHIENMLLIRDSPYYDCNSFKSLITSNTKYFSILSTNIQSLHAKFNELQAFVMEMQSLQFYFSVICIQESWLNDNADTSLIELQNYTCITQGKSSSTKGGLAMYINMNFSFKIHKLRIRNINWEAQVIQLSGGGLIK